MRALRWPDAFPKEDICPANSWAVFEAKAAEDSQELATVAQYAVMHFGGIPPPLRRASKTQAWPSSHVTHTELTRSCVVQPTSPGIFRSGTDAVYASKHTLNRDASDELTARSEPVRTGSLLQRCRLGTQRRAARVPPRMCADATAQKM